MEDININEFIVSMEHPNNEDIKKEIELKLKSKIIPDEIKDQIKSKFYNIDINSKDLGEEYDRYLIHLINKKRKDYKYLQAIFLIINNIEKNEILKKQGIMYELIEEENNLIIDDNWYIDINIDLIFNDNNYYYKYVKKIINELFELLNKEFLIKYIKIDFNKKGESYYKNNKEEFLSSIKSLFNELNKLTKLIDKKENKRKKKNKKKNKNKNIIINENNINNNEYKIKNDEIKIINDKNEEKDNKDKLNIDNNNEINNKINNISNINNINNNNNDIKKEIKDNNNNKLDNQNKNKIWLNNLKLNREELEIKNNNIYDKLLKNDNNGNNNIIINSDNKLENPDKCLDLISNKEIYNKFIDLEKQINDLKNINKIQNNQISQCQEDIIKLQKENNELKTELNNIKKFTDIYIYKNINKFIIKKIISKYYDKLKVEKKEKKFLIEFIDDINGIKVKDLNELIDKLMNNIYERKNDKDINYNFLNDIFNIINKDNNLILNENIIEKLLSKEELKEFYLLTEDIEITELIKDKFNI